MTQEDFEEAMRALEGNDDDVGIGAIARNDIPAAIEWVRRCQPQWPPPDQMKSLFMLQDDPERLRLTLLDAIERGELTPAP